MHGEYGPTYAVSFSSADASGVVKDVFDITGSTLTSYAVHALHLGKIAAALTSSAIETLAVSVWRGSSLAASGGATAAVIKMDNRSKATSELTAVINASTPGSSGAEAELLFARPWNTQELFVWEPAPEDRPICRLSQRLQVRLGASAAAIVIGGSLVVEELGRVPGSTRS